VRTDGPGVRADVVLLQRQAAELAVPDDDAAPDFAAAVRDKLVAEGERVLLQLLTPLAHGSELEAAMRMLSGSVLQSALLHGQLPGDEVIAATVDLLLRGLDTRKSSEGRTGERSRLSAPGSDSAP
jgi:hypothetical protein